MLHFILWLVIGGVIGWLASIVMRDNTGVLVNIVVGIVGSYIGGWLFGALFDLGEIGPYVSAFLGALILLAIINLIQKGRVR